jgi:hypothetical protein
MATQRKNSWSFFWNSNLKSSPPQSVCSPTEAMFLAEENSQKEEPQDSWDRITSANQRRYAEYVAQSFNIDVSKVQPR